MQMKALSFSRFGSPETVMAYQDVALPKPRAGEVRIRMVLAPIHNHHFGMSEENMASGRLCLPLAEMKRLG